MTQKQFKQKEIQIRKMAKSDISFIRSLTTRFAEVGMPSWREPAKMWQFHQRSLEEVITNSPPNSEVFVAEDMHGNRLGFIQVQGSEDFFTHEPQGYIAELAVSKEAEGKGVGALLITRGEAWARAQSYRILALDVFAMNAHARSFYEHQGYVEETLKLIKEL